MNSSIIILVIGVIAIVGFIIWVMWHTKKIDWSKMEKVKDPIKKIRTY